MRIFQNGFEFAVEGEELVVTRNDEACMRLPAIPRAEGETFRAGTWERKHDSHFLMRVEGLGSVNLALREGYACYWVETERKHFAKLTYFPDSQPTATRWQTFVSDELDRTWSTDENADVPISSSYIGMHVDGEDGAGMTDPGDKPPTWIWNVPARALAIETPRGWVGLSIPGPISVGVTRLTMRHGVFNLAFEELRPTAKEWGPPRVYFAPGLANPYDALDHHRIISAACGLMREEVKHHPDWWSYAPFKVADEIHRLNKGKWMDVDEHGNAVTALTTETGMECTRRVEEYARIQNRTNLEMDQLYFYGYGGKKVINTLGGNEGLRKTIDQLRERGVRMGLYLHLYMLDPTATDFPKEHPEAIARKKDPATVVKHGVKVGSQDMVYVDWTHPAGREYMMSVIEWMMSDKAGCLNADWLLMNNNMCVDPRKFDFHDPDWGTGDLMAMKATKLAYEKAKSIKPDCLVRRNSIAEPYMAPYCDITNMCEEWNGHTRAWYQRARIATRTLRNVIHQIDGWFVTLTKLTEYYFGLAAVAVPEIYSVGHAIHPYIYYREMRPKDYRRIRAGVQTYLNAPFKKGERCKVDFAEIERPEMWRLHCDGKLAGWYAAIGLDKRCLVTYSESEARLAASREMRVTVPVPPGAKIVAVEAVPHDGAARGHEYEECTAGGNRALRMWVEDAASETMYVRIRYKLA